MYILPISLESMKIINLGGLYLKDGEDLKPQPHPCTYKLKGDRGGDTKEDLEYLNGGNTPV